MSKTTPRCGDHTTGHIDREQLVTGLQESRERFEAVFEGCPFALALIRMPDAVTVGVNAAFERLFGYPREDVVGKPSFDLVIGDARGRSLVTAAVRERGSLRGFECVGRTRTDEERVLSLNVDPVRLGGADHALITIDDVTEKRQAEEALRESEVRFRSIVETTAEGVIISRPDGVITYANQQMADMLGHGIDDLVGTSGLDLIFPDWQTKVLENRAALDAGRVLRGDMKLRRRDGTPLWTWFSSASMFDKSGAHVANLTMHSDVTKRRLAEEALRKSEAEKAAQHERSRLARDLHDSVTQSLFASALKVEALKSGGEGLSSEARKIVEEVQRLNRGALAQMRMMLLELRGEPLETVPLGQLLRNVVETTESRSKVTVSLSIAGEASPPPQVHVAIYRIAQEAMNNVARHAKAANAWVRLDCEPSRARLVIGDDGLGFDPGPLDPSHLGLRSMRERAAEAGAEFSLRTAPGDGTEVTVVLEFEAASSS